MRKSTTALDFGHNIQLIQQCRKGFCFVFCQTGSQVFVKGCFDSRFGRFHLLRLFSREQQLTAAVIGILSAQKESLRFQISGSSANGCLIRVQNFRKLCLCAAGIVPQRMNQIDLCRTNAFFPQREKYKLFRFSGNFCNFPFGNVHFSSAPRFVVYALLYVQLL